MQFWLTHKYHFGLFGKFFICLVGTYFCKLSTMVTWCYIIEGVATFHGSMNNHVNHSWVSLTDWMAMFVEA